MKIGYYVQGDTDEAVIRGLAKRWCPGAKLAEGRFRGASKQSFRREIANSLMDLRSDKKCDVIVVLTDADVNRWQRVKQDEKKKIPTDCQYLTLFGVADRNIECWLAIDRGALARELECREEDIPEPDPSNFVKRRFGLTDRDTRQNAKARICNYVARASLREWIEGSDSFEDFYKEVRRWANQNGCTFPNELERDD